MAKAMSIRHSLLTTYYLSKQSLLKRICSKFAAKRREFILNRTQQDVSLEYSYLPVPASSRDRFESAQHSFRFKVLFELAIV